MKHKVAEGMERSRERMFAMMDRVHERNKDVPLEVIQSEVDEAIAAARGPKPKPWR